MTKLFASVRVQITMAALIVVGMSLGLVGTSVVYYIHRSLTQNLISTLTRQADTTATGIELARGLVPTPLKAVPGTALQIVLPGGVVYAASPELEGRPPISNDSPQIGETRQVHTNATLPNDQGQVVAVGTTVFAKITAYTVYSVATTTQVERTTRILELALLVSMPLVLVATGLVAWWLAGRALRPVEAIRREVSDISSKDLNRRVPVPLVDDEIGRLAMTMNEMLARLEDAQTQQRQFISDASHELRSPLASMLTQIEVAQAHPDTADWERVARTVSNEGIRLHRLVNDLLLLARSDEHTLELRRDEVDLDDLVGAEADRLRSEGALSIDTKRVGPARVVGDRSSLEQLLRNLVDNAARYANTTVSFEVRTAGERALMVISDDGPGVPPAQREEIFGRFARADESRVRRTGGTGLGLAIVKEITLAHGGTVVCEDASPGARFVVDLPALVDDEDDY